MIDHQFVEPFMPKEFCTPRVLPIWLFPLNLPIKSLSIEEKLYANKLSTKRSKQFAHSRSYTRHALSELWGVPPLSIPLKAPPGKAPTLKPGWGHISISHCSDALLVGWSDKKIGIDIERADRTFSAKKIASRYYSREENQSISNLKDRELNYAVLQQWVIKESCIKWQKGSIKSDIREWIFSDHMKYAIHNSYQYEVRIHHINLAPWIIAIASEKVSEKPLPMICLDSNLKLFR